MHTSEYLAQQTYLQRSVLDVELPFTDREKFADYFMMNIAALASELGEITKEAGWKPWSQDRGWVRKENLTREIIDAYKFLLNIAIGAGITAQEFEDAWREVHDGNIKRAREGYTTETK